MKNFKLTVQYDGTEYAGWQVQPHEQTIQSVIEEILRKLAPDSSRLIAAGRTDAGVHALEQVVCFRSGTKHSPDIIKNALNAQLPNDIHVLAAEHCDPDFNPRYDAGSKIYSYIIFNDTNISPFLHRFAWRVNYKLNIANMKKASENLLGRHDFSSFQASGCGAKNPVREILFIEIKKTKSMNFLTFKIQGNFLVVTVEANAFLRHMVRNIVGTLVEVGRGKMTAADIKKILSLKNRGLSGPTAPAHGLFLQEIFY